MTAMFDFRHPSYTPVFAERQERLAWLRENPEKLPGLKSFYKENIAQFICDWGMTSDTRNAERGMPVIIPFILFPKQKEWIDWLVERWRGQESGLTEKSRDMGLSWLSVATACTLNLFYKDINIGFGSRKEEYVDKIGDPKSLFYKARQFLELLPPEFTGGWNSRQHSSHMVIKFPVTGSTLTGEAGDNIGRGNRTAIYFKDESAFYERPEKIDAALSQTSNCKIDISTPNGNGNPFYKKRFGGNISVFSFRWTDDPRKDEAWYQKQCEELDAVTVAQEIDIDYSASVEGILIPGKHVQAAINLHKELGLAPSGANRCGLDVADEDGRDKNAIAHVIGTCVLEIDSWNGVDTHQTAMKGNAFARDCGASFVNYDSIGVGAGVRGSSKSLVMPFMPVAVSESPYHGHVINNPEVRNTDYYLNLKAQLCWELRIRFERAYQHVTGQKEWALDDMISIPNHAGLIAELSQPKFDYTDAGKIRIESKKQMKKRGIDSPNYFDSVILALAKTQKPRMAEQNAISSKAWT